MADRDIEFTIAAKDAFSATFGKAARDVQTLRKELNLPLTGPLTRLDQLSQDMALHSVRRVGRQQATNDIYRLGAPTAASEFGLSGGYGADVTRLRGGLAPQTRAEAAGTEKAIRLSEQAERFGKVLKLYGGVDIASRVGKSLEKIPDAGDKFRESLKHGATKVEAVGEWLADVVPASGPLARGFRRVYDWIDELKHPQKYADQRAAEEQKQSRAEMLEKQQKLAAERAPIILGARDAGREGRRQLGLLSAEGIQREMAQAEDELAKKLQDLNEKRAGRGRLTPEQAAQFDAEMADARNAAIAERNDKLKELNKRFAKDQEGITRDHLDRLREMGTAAKQADLERDGKLYEAKLAGIQNAAKDEQTAAIRKYRDALTNPDQDPRVAASQLDKEVAASRAKAAADRRKAEAEEQRDAEAARQAHEQRLLDQNAQYVSRELRMAGKATEADKLDVQQRYQARLAEIKKNLEDELKLHAERAPELRRQAAEDADAAGRGFALDNEELDRRRRAQFRADRPSGIAGESRLLTGEAGAGANPILEPVKEAAKTAEKSRQLQQRMSEDIHTLLTFLQSGSAKSGKPIPL